MCNVACAVQCLVPKADNDTIELLWNLPEPKAAVKVAFAPHAPVNTSTVHGPEQPVTFTEKDRPCESNTPVVEFAAAGAEPGPPSLQENPVGLLE